MTSSNAVETAARRGGHPGAFKEPPPSWRESLLAYVFLLPSLVVITVFGIYPIFRAGYISLHQWSIIKDRFIGVANYRTLLGDASFWKAMQVTVFYVIATVPLTMFLSLIVAYLLFKPMRARSFFRTLYFLPYVTSMVPAAMVWQWIFNYQSGILNFVAGSASQGIARVLGVVGVSPWIYAWLVVTAGLPVYLVVTSRRRPSLNTWFWVAVSGVLFLIALAFCKYPVALQNTVKQFATFFPVRWMQEPRGIILYLGRKWGFEVSPALQGPSMALIAVSLVSIWHFLGYDVVIYLAGLFNVPMELHEAARIDGASEGQIFFKITFPLLSPTTFFLLITSTIGAFRAFTMFYVLTAGGPLRTTTSVTYLVYDQFYTAVRVGYASAIAFVLFGIILVMTLINQRLAGRHVFYQ